MKYFTPEHYNRGNSPHPADRDGIEDAWDRAVARYDRRWSKIAAFLPESVRRFEAQRLCLHDAEVLSMGRSGDDFVWLLETERPARQPVVLTFALDDEPVIQTDTLDEARPWPVHWLYEEWDLDRRKRPTFEVLLSNGWVVGLVFRDFRFVTCEPVPLWGARQPPVARTA